MDVLVLILDSLAWFDAYHLWVSQVLARRRRHASFNGKLGIGCPPGRDPFGSRTEKNLNPSRRRLIYVPLGWGVRGIDPCRIQQRCLAHGPDRLAGPKALSSMRLDFGTASEPCIASLRRLQLARRQAELEVFAARRAIAHGAVAVHMTELRAEGIASEPFVKQCQARRDLLQRRLCCLQGQLLLPHGIKVRTRRRRWRVWRGLRRGEARSDRTHDGGRKKTRGAPSARDVHARRPGRSERHAGGGRYEGGDDTTEATTEGIRDAYTASSSTRRGTTCMAISSWNRSLVA